MAQNYAGQGCSVLYVFSTQLANRAAQAVSCHQFNNIIEFHRSQEETRQLLMLSPASASTFKPMSANAKKKYRGGSVSELATANVADSSGQSNEVVSHAVASVSDGSVPVMADPNGLAPAGVVKNEEHQQLSSVKSEGDVSISSMRPNADEPSYVGTSPLVSCSTILDAASIELPEVIPKICENPLEKMAKLTEEALPFEPPMKQTKLGSPRDRSKFTDDQLTPAQRQHRQEALQRIEDLKNFFGMSSQQQQTVLAMNAAAAAAGHPPVMIPPFVMNDGKAMNVSAENVSGAPLGGPVLSSRTEQQQVDAQLQWQQLVAEHEAKKQMHQGVPNMPVMSTSVCNSVPPSAAPTDVAFLRPGTRMVVQGKPALMVPPVAPPRAPQTVRGPRGPSVPPPSDGGYVEGPPAPPPNYNPPMGQGQPFPCGYDINVQQAMHFAMSSRPPGPRFMSNVGFSASADTAVVMMAGDRPQFPAGPEVGPCEPVPYGPVPADEGCMECPYPRNNAYAVYQQTEMGDFAPSTGGMNKVSSGQMPQASGKGGGYIAQGFDFELQGGPGQGPSMPMVNNTFVNATMSIQQVNIQNVSPYPGSVISMQGRPGQQCPPAPANQNGKEAVYITSS
ncbi:hypothetical protein M514_01893 [Trichuris suis]|uniref:Uncharacterized protein n=1 Tax=Trichuris suis TaxID=68888 RepID=A0A085NTH6_9BILA|nr:hypothetical protein M514_01893 [Trichuris suis]